MFDPIFFMGWVIQPTLVGFFVSDRVDRYFPPNIRFGTFTEAFLYVSKRAIGR